MRCDFCDVESEVDARYCRTCGRPASILPKESEVKLAAEHDTPEKAINSNSTSVIGIDFSNPPSPKKVVPLRNKAGRSTAARRHLRRKLQTIWLPVTVLVLQLAVAVATITYIRRNTMVLPQARMLVEETLALANIESALKARKEELDIITRKSEDLSRKVEEQERTSEEKQRTIEKLEEMVAVVKGELKEANRKVALAESRREELNEEIARDERQLRASKKESKMVVAQINRKKAEVTQLDAKLINLRAEVSQKQQLANAIQRKINSSRTTAKSGGRNRQTLRDQTARNQAVQRK